MKQLEVSKATMGRIPIYLRHLKGLSEETENISSSTLARELGLGEVQVRKDLGSVSGVGRPKTGYKVSELIESLEKYFKPAESAKVAIVGAGKLGRALLDYGGFTDYGLEIVGAFDIAVTKTEYSKTGKPIYPLDEFEDFCLNNKVKIGVITVPTPFAQEVADRFVANGIKGIWCFSHCLLNLPKDIQVQYENMALSLAYLNKKMQTD